MLCAICYVLYAVLCSALLYAMRRLLHAVKAGAGAKSAATDKVTTRPTYRSYRWSQLKLIQSTWQFNSGRFCVQSVVADSLNLNSRFHCSHLHGRESAAL